MQRTPHAAASDTIDASEALPRGGNDDLVGGLGLAHARQHPFQQRAAAERQQHLARQPGRPETRLNDNDDLHVSNLHAAGATDSS